MMQPVIQVEAAQELLDRRMGSRGTIVVNCVVHSDLDMTERPVDCERCMTDVKNLLRWAIQVNKWLNTWKEDATLLLKEVADAQEV